MDFTLNYSDGSQAKRGDSMIDGPTGDLVEYRGMVQEGGYAYASRGVRAIVWREGRDSDYTERIDPRRIGLTVTPQG
jgi:hypothetical protein